METLFTGHNLITLDAIASTNSYVLEQSAHARLPEGTVILAHHQFGGRGQRGSQWHSQPGTGLTMSIVYHPTFVPPIAQFNLNLMVSVGLVKWVSQLGIADVSVKWPNDIYVGDSKLAGILIENVIKGDQILQSVIGIGVNVNNVTFSPELPNAISLRMLNGGLLNVNECVKGICSFIEKQYLRLRAGDKENLKADYKKLLYRLDKPSQFYVAGELTTGVITGVTDTGKLLLSSNGETKEYDLKEIRFL